MNKDLSYYMSLPYAIEIRRIPEDEGGGYMAGLPEIGRYALCADGDTVEEAVCELERLKEERFREYLEQGVAIPEPEAEDEYSGRFVLRVPKYLHRELVLQARRNGSSLNQYAVSLLSAGLTGGALQLAEVVESVQRIETELQILRTDLCRLNYVPVTNLLQRSSEDKEIYCDDDYEQAA